MPRPPELWTGDYRPLRVVAHLAGPIAMLPHDGLPLDGILEWAASRLNNAWVQEARVAGLRAGPAGTWPKLLQYERDGSPLPALTHDDPVNFVLPLKRHGHHNDPDWYWYASWATFPQGFELDRTYWNKRFDGGSALLGDHLDFGSRRGNINVTAGRYKSYHMPLSLVVAPVVEWYCLGAFDGITRLLAQVHQLGHKRSQGYGEVRKFEVLPSRQDGSLWRNGQPSRCLPVNASRIAAPDQAQSWVGIRAPYWSPRTRRLCIVPPDRR